MAEEEIERSSEPAQLGFDAKKELEAMGQGFKLLEKLSPQGRNRVVSYWSDAFQLTGIVSTRDQRQRSEPVLNKTDEELRISVSNARYPSFAELLDAANPGTGAEKALVGGYWFQVCQSAEDFAAADVNKALGNVVGPLSNVTVALDALRSAKPARVIQIGKSGKAQQARKKYKLTIAGIRVVEDMISRSREA